MGLNVRVILYIDKSYFHISQIFPILYIFCNTDTEGQFSSYNELDLTECSPLSIQPCLDILVGPASGAVPKRSALKQYDNTARKVNIHL